MKGAPVLEATIQQLLRRVREVRATLGLTEMVDDAGAQFAELLDSMGMVEFLMLVARDHGVPVSRIEECVGHQFTTLAGLAEGLRRANLTAYSPSEPRAECTTSRELRHTSALRLAATAVRLPRETQWAEQINRALGRPAGWLETRAGIRARHVWREEDPLDAAAETGRECLEAARLLPEEIGVLLTTSEAPPLAVGLAAALHHRLNLRPQVPALEIGGACVGFLAGLRVGSALGKELGPVLLVAVEAPSRYLRLEATPSGEAAALLGDGAAAAVVSPAEDSDGVTLGEITLSTDGASRLLVQVDWNEGRPHLHLGGSRLVSRAVHAMGEAVRDLLAACGLNLEDLTGIVAHGGNGRMPGLLARELGLPRQGIWSTTAETGNLGSASLPFAWHSRPTDRHGWVVWTAAGAGLTAGAALMRSP